MLDYLKRLVTDRLPKFVNYMVVRNVMFTKLLQSMAGIENMPSEINEIIKKTQITLIIPMMKSILKC